MPRRLVLSALLLICALPWWLAAQTGPTLLHREPSMFGEVLVFEENGQRCLNFDSMTTLSRQTCMSLQTPQALLFAYVRMMVSALYVRPAPRSILIVGLGGATLQKTLAQLLPEAVIDSVEIDPAVAKVATAYFGYQQGPKQRLFIDDGRAYIEQAQRAGKQYDMVMLDAFDVDYIPRHLTTLEFLSAVKAILTPEGIVAANTFTSSRLYEQESATYAAVFGPYFNLRHNNRVIIAARGDLPSQAEIAQRADQWEARFSPLGIQKSRMLPRFSEYGPAIADEAAILRDAP